MNARRVRVVKKAKEVRVEATSITSHPSLTFLTISPRPPKVHHLVQVDRSDHGLHLTPPAISSGNPCPYWTFWH
jgi:hypothetical protein